MARSCGSSTWGQPNLFRPPLLSQFPGRSPLPVPRVVPGGGRPAVASGCRPVPPVACRRARQLHVAGEAAGAAQGKHRKHQDPDLEGNPARAALPWRWSSCNHLTEPSAGISPTTCRRPATAWCRRTRPDAARAEPGEAAGARLGGRPARPALPAATVVRRAARRAGKTDPTNLAGEGSRPADLTADPARTCRYKGWS